jgi:hypothetical protein
LATKITSGFLSRVEERMAESVEELKRSVSELKERDYRATVVLERVRYTLEDVRNALLAVKSEYERARRSSKGFERDFYGFALFAVLQAAGYVERARRHIQDVLNAYEGKGTYWEEVVEEE